MLECLAREATNYVHVKSGGQDPAEHPRKHLKLTAAPPSALRDPIVGRRSELDALAQALGRAGLYFVQGPTGIGKSRLVDEFLAFAREEGFEAIVGRCYPIAESRPYAPLLDAFEQLRSDQPFLDQFANLDRESAGVGDRLGQDMTNRRATSLRRLARVLASEVSSRSTILFVDDIQWADPATLLLLNMLVDLESLRIVCVARTDEPVEPESAVLIDRLRDEATVMTVRGLSDREAAQFLRVLTAPGRLSALECRSLNEFTGGNPLFMKELFLHLEESGLLNRHTAAEALTRSRVPDHLTATVDLRLKRLEPALLATLGAAAVIGDECSSSLVAQACDLPEDIVTDHMNAGVSLRMLIPLDDAAGQRFRFAHPFLAMRLYETMPSAEKRRLHEAIASSWSRGKASLSLHEIARHTALGFGAAAGANAIGVCRAAAEQSERVLAYETAARFWELALLGVGALTSPAVIADVYRRLGWALWAARKWPQACDAWREAALRFEAQSNNEDLAEVALGLADVYRWQQDLPGAEHWAERALTLPLGSVADQARAVTLLASVRALQDDSGTGELLERARTLWLEAGRDPSVTWWLAHSFLMAGDLRAAHEVASRGLEVAVDRGHAHTATLLASGLIVTELGRLNLREAHAYLRLGKRATEVTDAAARLSFLDAEAFLSEYIGDWQAVVAICEQSMAEARLASPYQLAIPRLIWSNAQLALGDATAARRGMEEALPATETMRPAASVYLARVLLNLKRPEEALHIVSTYADAILTNQRLAAARAVLGEVVSALDAPDLWRACYESLARERRQAVIVYSLTSVQRVLGRLASRLKDWPAATEHLERASEVLSAGGALWELALTYIDFAAMRMARGRRGDLGKAQAMHLRAREIFDQLGIEYAMTPIEWPGANRFALTSRELEVLELVAEGRRNQEIAERLTLSLRTVEYHLNSILGKMGVASRGEAIIVAVQAGIAGPPSASGVNPATSFIGKGGGPRESS